MFTTNAPLILASGSPRRKAFLSELGLKFSVHIPDVDEKVLPGENPESFVKRISSEKAMNIAVTMESSWVLAADTVVVIDDKILGKPADIHAAFSMLKNLSGRQHKVWTGFCLSNVARGVEAANAVCTKVNFADLPDTLCRAYAHSGEPLDKAGAYGIQGNGGLLVKSISGSYSNVVGLPLAEVMAELISHGVVTPRG